jgi:hypothetical protein
MEAILFMFCLTIHNIEEALWFTEWRIKYMQNSRNKPEKECFVFAVLGITIIGYLTAGLFILFPNNLYFEYIFIGFVGAMLINAIMPHLLLTIKHKNYCPGVLTGCFLIIPFHTIILINFASEEIKIIEMIIATSVVGLKLLGLIPILFFSAKKVLENWRK